MLNLSPNKNVKIENIWSGVVFHCNFIVGNYLGRVLRSWHLNRGECKDPISIAAFEWKVRYIIPCWWIFWAVMLVGFCMLSLYIHIRNQNALTKEEIAAVSKLVFRNLCSFSRFCSQYSSCSQHCHHPFWIAVPRGLVCNASHSRRDDLGSHSVGICALIRQWQDRQSWCEFTRCCLFQCPCR